MWSTKNCKDWTEKSWITIMRNPLADILPVPKNAMHHEHYPNLVLEGFRQHHHQRMELLNKMPLTDNPIPFFNALMYIEPQPCVLVELLNKIEHVQPEQVDMVLDLAVWLSIQHPKLFEVARAWCLNHIKNTDVCGSKALATAISIDDMALVQNISACYQGRIAYDKALSACFAANNTKATQWLFDMWLGSYQSPENFSSSITSITWQVLVASKMPSNEATQLWMDLIAPWSEGEISQHLQDNGSIAWTVGEDTLSLTRSPDMGDTQLARALWTCGERASLLLRSLQSHFDWPQHFLNMLNTRSYAQAALVFPLLCPDAIHRVAQHLSTTTVDQLAPWPDIRCQLSAHMLHIHTDAMAHQLPQRRRVM